MEIAVLHLTDAHFEMNSNFLVGKEEFIFKAVKNEIYGVEKIYLIVSGDLINKGNTNSFLIFNKFILKLKDLFEEKYQTKIILVPGNHDCDFSKNNSVREILLNNISYQTLEKDLSLINEVLKVQGEFWINFKHFNPEPENRLFYQIIDIINNKKVVFNCFNSAWMSSINETANLFFPVSLIEGEMEIQKGDINIAVIHHPISWFKSDGGVNNRKEVANFIEENNSLVLFGHEHEEEFKKSTAFWTNRQTVQFSGKILQNNFKKESGFNLIRINLLSKYSIIHFYDWKEDSYLSVNEKDFQLNGDVQATKRFKSNLTFLENLNKPNIPVLHDNDYEILLNDIYVFPDLEKRDRKTSSKILDDYIDSEKLTDFSKYNKVIIEGENQSGKSSLISSLYQIFFDNDKFPIIVDSKNIKSKNIDSFLKSEFEKQYEYNESIYQKFKQYDLKDKIILIDNFQNIKLPTNSIKEFLTLLEEYFGKILIFSNSLLNLVPHIEIEVKEIETFIIRPLGYKKRNELIEKFHRLNPNSREDHILLEKTKDSYNVINQILGNKLLPSYPVFILSLLQTLTHFKSSGLDQTSYGHCYHSLIYLGLAKKAKIQNENIDSYFNFLSEFSLFYYKKNKSYFTESDLEEFYYKYSDKYLMPVSFDELKINLLNSGLFLIYDEEWKFSYKYIYYFLVAKKLSEILNLEDGKDAVRYLCKNIHVEKNANILIFIAHHSKDDFLIQEATFTAMVPFEEVQPITLNKDGSYYNIIKDVIDDIVSDIIDLKNTPKENRDKILEEQDERERLNSKKSDDVDDDDNSEDISETMTSFYQAFRAIEIVGQLIKNRKGSIQADQLVDMIVELYNTAFRTINFFGINLKEAKEHFVNDYISNYEVKNVKEVEKKINSFLQILALNVCFGVFGKVVHSVGQKDLKSLFIRASHKIGTPAADLVTFMINSYYGNLSRGELDTIVKKYEKNLVAMQIIKSRVKSFVYQNNVDIKKKQHFADVLKMKLK